MIINLSLSNICKFSPLIIKDFIRSLPAKPAIYFIHFQSEQQSVAQSRRPPSDINWNAVGRITSQRHMVFLLPVKSCIMYGNCARRLMGVSRGWTLELSQWYWKILSNNKLWWKLSLLKFNILIFDIYIQKTYMFHNALYCYFFHPHTWFHIN